MVSFASIKSNNLNSLFRCYLNKTLNITRFTSTSLFLISLICLPVLASSTYNPSLIHNSPKEIIDQVWQIIYRDYMDSTGQYNTKKWKKLRYKLLSTSYDDSESAYEAIRGMLASLEDPYTRFLDKKEFSQMKIDTSGELTGVGIQISIDEATKNIIVIAPIEGSPAFISGVLSNDLIISIDGKATKGMSIENVVNLIRGKVGTEVVIGILRGNQIINLSLLREKIELPSVTNKLNELKSGHKIGYIRIKQFTAKASNEMRTTINSLESKGSEAYVVDLRNNPGGLLEASIDISRQLLDRGVIVSTKTKRSITDVIRAKGNSLTSKPIAILVNQGSASASEILSAAIQDNGRGILVGNKTYGKGLVQSVRPLIDGSGLTVTVAKYLTPNGLDIHRNGIKPDIKVNLTKDKNKTISLIDLGTDRDNQYSVAEKTLVKILNRRSNNTTYIPTKTNFLRALKN